MHRRRRRQGRIEAEKKGTKEKSLVLCIFLRSSSRLLSCFRERKKMFLGGGGAASSFLPLAASGGRGGGGLRRKLPHPLLLLPFPHRLRRRRSDEEVGVDGNSILD